MQIRQLPANYIRNRFTRLSLFEGPILILALLYFYGVIEDPNGKSIGIGMMLVTFMGSGFLSWRILTRLRCEECGTMLKGSPSKGWTCHDCNIRYEIKRDLLPLQGRVL